MKKFTYLCLVLLLSSCASLNTLRDNTNEKKRVILELVGIIRLEI